MKGLFVSLLIVASSILHAQQVKRIDSDQLFSCFKQGKSGDCVSVGFIKAAICVYGINGVFTEKALYDSKTEVTLKNGKKYIVTKEEFAIADTAMHIKPGINADTEIMRYATHCFAVMAKVKQDIDNLETFEESIHKLQRSASGHKIFYKLGLENNVELLSNTPDSICGGIAWTKKHVVFVCNGFMDLYGKKIPLDPKYYGGLRLIP